ncbi:MAG: glycogen/starch/alpha-glucan family phosphorylase, partial [Oscillospiraceae bacterium]|nr:glycogen/starch/alpha-glucan family phosphorylase [Oscillospiraceae bacterium]
ITRVLYPNDSNDEGKRLRIKQQYVLSSASLQDMLRVFKLNHGDLNRFAEFNAVQLNDTHPAMSIPELIRLLMKEGMSFEQAFPIAQKTFSYTNHTVLGEALEKWPLHLLRSVVPEIADIICKIDHKLRQESNRELWIIQDDIVHMANLSIYVGSYVNGVAEIHSKILIDDVFNKWYKVFPERFQNKTNGITPRRWFGLCNPELSGMVREKVGTDFLKNLDEIGALKGMIDDETVGRFNYIKHLKKEQLCNVIAKHEGVQLNPDFMFDVQVKRLHMYKRQLMNALSIMDIYFRLKDGRLPNFYPTCFIFGAKAAPGYEDAKSVIRYINRIAKLINNDPAVNNKMRVCFVQNYNCSYAEHIIPAADISEQISPAGLEASGTGNMKLMLNGAVTLGTLDGANVEIAQEAGHANEYIFGATVDEINAIKGNYYAKNFYDANPDLRRAVDTMVNGTIETDAGIREVYNKLINWGPSSDQYYVMKDYASYIDAKLRANAEYADRLAFGRKCLMNVASAAKFSSDRTIRQYASDIWHIEPTVR